MKSNITLLAFFLFLFFGFSANGQSYELMVQDFLEEHKSELELQANDIRDWVIYDHYKSKKSDITHVHIRQKHAGIEIYNAVANFNFKD